ncbi:hypothetical protein [Pseudovibrio brasiliensis]|uniref:Uncharacterized protein n=1 Tax=Pseudovibrio brasiliensis TaxID=1898042 RepID=A0ABX8AMM5_9HYPH|nr:hypothetical protein [Pseudovibrio brasiliensis]QUS55517.1 hypothetical protein KGB56_19700 [Pseudovibrio brasiliensis]
MAKTIEISDTTYSQLEKLASGFESPDNVIQRLLLKTSTTLESKPELVFDPQDEREFKKQLMLHKCAEVIIHKADGSKNISIWHADRFSENSNLRGNLWSGYLRGWKEAGIVKAELKIKRKADAY